jgi:RecB family endonuclease NucS
MRTIGLWQISDSGPSCLQNADVALERDLEVWIERDPALLERGLVIVGRQIRLESGPLDLLALDPQGRWVLIEIKRERLRREALFAVSELPRNSFDRTTELSGLREAEQWRVHIA